jgi:ubiquitin-protein ligase
MPWSRLERIRTEAIYAAARYSRSRRVDIDPDGGWVVIYDFELPPYYNYETVDILIELPPDYPATPPQWFYTDPGLRRRDGKVMSHYFQHQLRERSGWAACCLHIRSWAPTADPLQGHSLLSVCRLIYDAFVRWGR